MFNYKPIQTEASLVS